MIYMDCMSKLFQFVTYTNTHHMLVFVQIKSAYVPAGELFIELGFRKLVRTLVQRLKELLSYSQRKKGHHDTHSLVSPPHHYQYCHNYCHCHCCQDCISLHLYRSLPARQRCYRDNKNRHGKGHGHVRVAYSTLHYSTKGQDVDLFTVLLAAICRRVRVEEDTYRVPSSDTSHTVGAF